MSKTNYKPIVYTDGERKSEVLLCYCESTNMTFVLVEHSIDGTLQISQCVLWVYGKPESIVDLLSFDDEGELVYADEPVDGNSLTAVYAN